MGFEEEGSCVRGATRGVGGVRKTRAKKSDRNVVVVLEMRGIDFYNFKFESILYFRPRDRSPLVLCFSSFFREDEENSIVNRSILRYRMSNIQTLLYPGNEKLKSDL